MGLIENGLSIVPDALANYIVRYCPNLIPWDANTSFFDEEDPEQMQALHELKGMELMGDLVGTFSRLLDS